MRIFLTGSTGMVGSNLRRKLDDNGHIVFAPTRQELNLLHFENILAYCLDTKPDMIIHAAGKVGGIQANMINLAGFLHANTIIGFNIVEAARQCGIKRLLNLGSSCMYPKDSLSILREDDILSGKLEPTNEGYAIAKISTMKLCEFITAESESLHYKTVIPCNLYGEHDSFEEGKSHLIPAAIKKVHEASRSSTNPNVVIWGDGTARREFMYVQDFISSVMFSIDHFDDIPVVMNIGLSCDYSVKEYYEFIAEIVGFTGQFEYDLDKPTGMKRKLLDSSIQQGLGWTPRYSIQEGLRSTYNYFLKTHSCT